uniref:Ig-like domain-containing protein n=1 Tax=Amphimedon queenslandica TaxID=400682 RepID=A0A1X7SW01_AMPQE
MGNSPDMSTLTSTGSVRTAHAGMYRCVAMLSPGSPIEDTGILTVTIPTPTVTASTNPAIVGSNAQLICAVTLPSYSSYSSASSDLYVQVMWNRNLPSIILPAAMNTVNGTHMFTGVSVNDSGAYACTARVFYNGTSHSPVTDSAESDTGSTTLNVKFPTPTVTASTNITEVLAGDDVELICTVSMPDYNANIYGNSFLVAVTWNRGVDAMNHMYMASQIFSSTLSNVATNDSGNYACTAQVFFTGIQSNIVNSDVSAASTPTTLNVKIPAPTVTLSSASVAVGRIATITCTVTISPFVDLNGLNYMTRTVTPSTGGTLGSIQGNDTHTQSFTYTISNAMSINGVSYTCTVALNHPNATIITSDNAIGNGTIYVSSVTVTPETVTRLDVSPYNRFTLNCAVTTNPSPNNLGITYSWTNNSGSQAYTYSGATESMLTVTASVMDSFTYTCNASITVNGVDGTAMPSDSTSVTIK